MNGGLNYIKLPEWTVIETVVLDDNIKVASNILRRSKIGQPLRYDVVILGKTS